jgi:hypothetical protein
MKLKKNKLINKNQKSYKESNFKGRKEKKKTNITNDTTSPKNYTCCLTVKETP